MTRTRTLLLAGASVLTGALTALPLAVRAAERAGLAPRVRPAVKGLVRRPGDGDAEYLLVRQPTGDGERWVLPGGGVERGEDQRAALEREVREEVGLDVTVGDPVEAYGFRLPALGGVRVVATVFDCEVAGDADPRAGDGLEPIEEVRWVTAGEAWRLDVPEDLPDALFEA